MRTLDWDGYLNARDLGGLPTPASPTGRTVPGRTVPGRIARGPRRERLTGAGWREATERGLRTVVDLRCPHEVGRRESDPIVDDRMLAGIRIVSSPTEDQDDPAFREACFPILDSPTYWEHNWRLQPQLVRGALEAIAAASPGVLVHCSAGRDRTGMVSALLLAGAGVDPEHVAADYASSVRAMAGTSAHAPTVDRQSAWGPDAVEAWLATATPVVRDVARHVDEAFRVLSVGPSTRARLRGLLTSPSIR